MDIVSEYAREILCIVPCDLVVYIKEKIRRRLHNHFHPPEPPKPYHEWARGPLRDQCPLPAQRQRALTLPLPPHNPEGTIQRTCAQSQSALLIKLPFDIRTMIWELAIEGLVFRIYKGYSRLGSGICQETTPWNDARRFHHCWRGAGDRYGFVPLDIRHSLESRKLIALMLTCRWIYSETIGNLYSRNTFAFTDLDTLLHFPTTVLSQRWNCIRSLRLKWSAPYYDEDRDNFQLRARPSLWHMLTWKRTAHLIVSMQGLRELGLIVRVDFKDPSPEFVEKLLLPLRGLNARSKIEIGVRWALDEEGEEKVLDGITYREVSNTKFNRNSIWDCSY